MTKAKSAAEAMAVLEALLTLAKPSFDATARPITFVFPGSEWSFDPSRKGELFAPFPCRGSVLSVHTTPELLDRLLTEKSFYLKPGERFRLKGDSSALTPIASALSRAATTPGGGL